ncbi:unnamed protein product, partial [Ectocarpus sp. 13 AM-2016]
MSHASCRTSGTTITHKNKQTRHANPAVEERQCIPRPRRREKVQVASQIPLEADRVFPVNECEETIHSSCSAQPFTRYAASSSSTLTHPSPAPPNLQLFSLHSLSTASTHISRKNRTGTESWLKIHVVCHLPSTTAIPPPTFAENRCNFRRL